MENAGAIKNVLVVEDDSTHSVLIGRAFENVLDSYSVKIVDTLAAARNQIEKQMPDIVLVDFRLPDGAGDELLQASSELFPVLILTSHGDEQLAVKAIKAGALDYIVKSPDAFATLSHTVDRALREWNLVQEKQLFEAERAILVDLLRLLNGSGDLRELMKAVVLLLKEWSGCGAVGIRLRDGDDFPYYEFQGFPAEFIAKENKLCARNADGSLLRDAAGNPLLECICGNVLCGRFDPARPFFTANGSFWSNDNTDLLAKSAEDDFLTDVREAFLGAGYKSVALIPMRTGKTTLGLLQFNDTRKGRFTPWRIAVLEKLAATLAEGVARRLAEKKLQDSGDELKRLNEVLEERIIARTENLHAINVELESFIYSVSHDLRSPMQTMAGFSEALLEDYTARMDEDGKKYLHYLHDGTIRMREMVDALLELSRAARNELARTSLDISMIARAVMLEMGVKYAGRTVKYAAADNMAGSGDERLVRNLLIHLFDNALKFTGKTEEARVDFGCIAETGEKIFFVRDNGIGFDMRQADSLFKPFKRLCAKNEFPGLGIGLAIAKRLVGRHGGRIWAESKPGMGTTVYFTLE